MLRQCAVRRDDPAQPSEHTHLRIGGAVRDEVRAVRRDVHHRAALQAGHQVVVDGAAPGLDFSGDLAAARLDERGGHALHARGGRAGPGGREGGRVGARKLRASQLGSAAAMRAQPACLG